MLDLLLLVTGPRVTVELVVTVLVDTIDDTDSVDGLIVVDKRGVDERIVPQITFKMPSPSPSSSNSLEVVFNPIVLVRSDGDEVDPVDGESVVGVDDTGVEIIPRRKHLPIFRLDVEKQRMAHVCWWMVLWR